MSLEDIFSSFLGDEPAGAPIELSEPADFYGGQRTTKKTANGRVLDVSDLDVNDIPQILQDRMRDYVLEDDPGYMLLVRATPGSGKSWSGVKLAYWAAGKTRKKIFYAAPRHPLYGDLIEAASEQNLDPTKMYEWLPRQDGLGKVTTCIHSPIIGEWMRRGYNGINFCQMICGQQYMKTECGYHAQKKRKEPFIFGQHQNVTVGHMLSAKFHCLIGDEFPLSAFLDKRLITVPNLMRNDLNKLPQAVPLVRMIQDMIYLCGLGRKVRGDEMIRYLTPQGIEAAMQSYQHPYVQLLFMSPGLDPLNPAASVENTPYSYLDTFFAMAKREVAAFVAKRDYPNRLSLAPDGLTMLCRKHYADSLPSHIIWFDGTGRKDIYESMFEREVEEIYLSPPLQGEIIQITDRVNSKSGMVEEGKPTKQALQAKDLVKAITDQHSGRVAVITYKDIADLYSEVQGRGDLEITHFFGNRGGNALQGVEALIVIGTPMISPEGIVEAAKMLYYDRDEPFDTAWILDDRDFIFSDEEGEGRAQPIGTFRDPALNAILWQFREAEIVQSAHRGRPLRHPISIYLLSSLPVDELPPTKILTMREIMQAPEGVNIFEWKRIVEAADGLLAEGKLVTASGLGDKLEVSHSTALDYMRKLVKTGEWEVAILRTNTGRQQQAVSRRTA